MKEVHVMTLQLMLDIFFHWDSYFWGPFPGVIRSFGRTRGKIQPCCSVQFLLCQRIIRCWGKGSPRKNGFRNINGAENINRNNWDLRISSWPSRLGICSSAQNIFTLKSFLFPEFHGLRDGVCSGGRHHCSQISFLLCFSLSLSLISYRGRVFPCFTIFLSREETLIVTFGIWKCVHWQETVMSIYQKYRHQPTPK